MTHDSPGMHARLHAPQFSSSRIRSTSHPVLASLSHSAKPASHDPVTHRPALQPGLPFSVTHAGAVHVPQWAGS